MLNIKGKSYTYCNWAICAYHYIENEQLDTILPNESLIIKIMSDAKALRKYDFLKNAAIQYSESLKHKMKNLNKISYIPTISYKYILDFAKSDKMQCDIDILEYIINEIKKINGKLILSKINDISETESTIEAIEEATAKSTIAEESDTDIVTAVIDLETEEATKAATKSAIVSHLCLLYTSPTPRDS